MTVDNITKLAGRCDQLENKLADLEGRVDRFHRTLFDELLPKQDRDIGKLEEKLDRVEGNTIKVLKEWEGQVNKELNKDIRHDFGKIQDEDRRVLEERLDKLSERINTLYDRTADDFLAQGNRLRKLEDIVETLTAATEKMEA